VKIRLGRVGFNREATVAELIIAPAVATVPSPLAVAQVRHKPRPPATSTAVPVYSTSSGTANTHLAEHTPDDEIDDVVDNVVSTWWRGASQTSRDELMRGKPIIPAELDRTLLNDLNNRLAVYDVPQDWRFALRDAFWAKVGNL
jgi:hypothetical protein